MSDRVKIPDGDYELTDGAAWLTCGPFAVRVALTDEGVAVDVYPEHRECDIPVAATYAFTAELEEDES